MINVGIISVSDRAFNKVYQDKGIPEIEKIFSSVTTFKVIKKIIIPDEKEIIKENLVNLSDIDKLDIIITTGGTGPSSRRTPKPDGKRPSLRYRSRVNYHRKPTGRAPSTQPLGF